MVFLRSYSLSSFNIFIVNYYMVCAFKQKSNMKNSVSASH